MVPGTSSSCRRTHRGLTGPGGVGDTQGDPARFAGLIDDVEQRLLGTLPDDTWCHPGREKDTTPGAERPHLGEWRARGW